LREDQLLAPKIQRLLKRQEKEKEKAMLDAAEDFQIQGAPKQKSGKANNKWKDDNPVIQYGLGKLNPNRAKKYYSKKQKK